MLWHSSTVLNCRAAQDVAKHGAMWHSVTWEARTCKYTFVAYFSVADITAWRSMSEREIAKHGITHHSCTVEQYA
eukprot:8981892-Pyramimonas_sp.AAC.1